MGIVGTTTGVADKKGEKLCELENEERYIAPYPCPNPKSNSSGSKGKKSKKRHQRKMPSPVQKLHDTCKEVFTFGASGTVPSPDNIDKLRAVLDDIKPSDLGLNPDMPYFRTTVAGITPVIGYLHLHECDKFSMGVFCLPPSGVIPLHNHPGMTVFSKLLFGTMHIKSYDWVADDPSNTSTVENAPKGKQSVQEQDVNPDLRLAKVKANSDLTAPCNTSILYPADGGNMHCFTALTACAVLDVLGPPYSDPDGRHCQYYYDFPYTKFSVGGMSIPEVEQEGYAWLQERESPEDLVVVGDIYRGPKITE